MSKAVSAEPNGTTAQSETDDEPQHSAVGAVLADVELDGTPATHRRMIRDLLARAMDESLWTNPLDPTKVRVATDDLKTVVYIHHSEGCIDTTDLQRVGIDLEDHDLRSWYNRTSVVLRR